MTHLKKWVDYIYITMSCNEKLEQKLLYHLKIYKKENRE